MNFPNFVVFFLILYTRYMVNKKGHTVDEKSPYLSLLTIWICTFKSCAVVHFQHIQIHMLKYGEFSATLHGLPISNKAHFG